MTVNRLKKPIFKMPGGSVNGRPFRESPDSYERTGIPCGNPKRFRSHDVVRMEPGRRTASSRIDGPVEEIETAGQRHLQELLRKQLDSKIPLQKYIHQRKEFSRSAEYNPVSKDNSGMLTLDEYQVLEKTDGYIDELKSCGLTTEEILLKLQADEGSSEAKKGRYANSDHEKNRLLEIERKIAEKKAGLDKPDTFANVKKLSRHDMDLEKTISAGNQSNAFLHKVLIQERDSQLGTSSNVMSQLPEIIASVSNSELTKLSSRKKSRRKLKHDKYKAECSLECCTGDNCANFEESESTGNNDDSNSDLVDIATIPTCAEKPEGFVSQYDDNSKASDHKKHEAKKEKEKKNSSFCVVNRTQSISKQSESRSEQNRIENATASSSFEQNEITDIRLTSSQNDNYINCDNEIRTLYDVEGIPREAIIQHKLSSEEVKKLPRFENYEPGEPSNVLYVKNLPPKLTEEELAALFIDFQKNNTDKIVFKLLTGRMKGQAFVTFPDICTAGEALELVHGYEYKGKPVIIQYGKKTTC